MEVDDELQTLVAEQLRELTAALTEESDNEYAFKLQMQEAMNTSLSVNPSSSSTQMQFDDGDPVIGVVHVLADEIEKFEIERSDRKKVEAEMRRVREDLSRQIHDRNFARHVLAIPEVEWQNTGNWFHKPYEGCSAVETLNRESFRLYCKSLVSEQTVGSVKKVLGGMGVVISDSSGEVVIFELRKPLILGDMSAEIAEVKALIEGLNAAVSLGLKRITIFTDDTSVYQVDTGKWVRRQGYIETLVDQVTLLQRKFTHFTPNFVARQDIKYASELARDAIVLHVTWPGESSGHINIIETCIICLEDRDVSQILSVDGCQHRYCFSCMKQHVVVKLQQGMLPRCPHEGCKSELKTEGCVEFLTSEVLDLMSQRLKEASVPVTEKFYCPYPRCSALMSRDEICGTNANRASRCINCQGLFCYNCEVPWHNNMSCSLYKQLHPYPCVEDAKLKSLATKKKWRQCVKCSNMVELKEGCYHIYCRCGHEFCYVCGAEWRNKKPTCACLIWDERNIVYAEQNRRRG